MHHKRLDQSPAPKPNVCVTAEWRLRLAFEQLSGHGPLGGHHDLLTVDRPSVRERHRPLLHGRHWRAQLDPAIRQLRQRASQLRPDGADAASRKRGGAGGEHSKHELEHAGRLLLERRQVDPCGWWLGSRLRDGHAYAYCTAGDSRSGRQKDAAGVCAAECAF